MYNECLKFISLKWMTMMVKCEIWYITSLHMDFDWDIESLIIKVARGKAPNTSFYFSKPNKSQKYWYDPFRKVANYRSQNKLVTLRALGKLPLSYNITHSHVSVTATLTF